MRTIKLNVNSGESIQRAIDSVKKESYEQLEIFLKKGIYKEKIIIDIPNVTFIGEDRDETILDFADSNGTESPEGGKYGTFRSASFSVMKEAEGFTAKNLTFQNSFDYDNCGFKENRQAVALRCNADKSYFENCRFLGNQDTLLPNTGRQQYIKCYIEGHIDFIFGGAQAYFNECEIYSKDRGEEENGYICAPSTLKEKENGFIFENCKFLSDAKEKTVYLGRPWHPGKNPGHKPAAIFINSYLGAHIKDEGWTSMSGFLPEDARFYECDNYGPGAVQNKKRELLKKEIIKNYIKKIKF